MCAFILEKKAFKCRSRVADRFTQAAANVASRISFATEGIMGTGRSYVALAFALGIVSLSGCAAESADEDSKGNGFDNGEDWGDEQKYPELGGKFAALNGLQVADGTCTIGTGANAGKVAIDLQDTAQTLVVGLRTVDSQLLVNGKICGTTGIVAKNIKTLAIKVAGSATTSVQNVVLDFLSGQFAPGIKLSGTAPTLAASPGITIDLGTTVGDTVAIRGSAKTDLIGVGAGSANLSMSRPLISFNADAYPDIVLQSDAALTFSLAGGVDTFLASGVTALNLGGNYTGNVTVFGGSGGDKLTGGDGNDSLHGGDDGDVIIGGAGDDAIYGEAGDDVITAAAVVDGSDTIDCGSNATSNPVGDKVSYEMRTDSVSVSAGVAAILDNGTDTIYGTADDIVDFGANAALGGGDDVVVKQNDGDVATNEKDNVFTNCENLVGGAGDDTLQGSTGTNSFKGGAGSDTVDYSDRSAAVTVNLANGTATATSGDPTANAGAGEKDSIDPDIENVRGGSGNDSLNGNDAANEFWGGLGNDVMVGGKGDDTFHETIGAYGADNAKGGTGSNLDTEPNGSDEMNGGDGFDTVDYSERALAVAVSPAGTAAVSAGAGDDGTATPSATVTTANVLTVTFTSTENDNVWANVEGVNGGDGADHLLGDQTANNTTANTIDGGAGINYINGFDGDDNLVGGAGADYIFGGNGEDQIDGNGGANKFDCGAGDDLAFSGTEMTAGVLTCELLF